METASVTIDALSSTGEGIGSLDGMKIFVDGALPGETVLAKITEQKKTYAKAALLSIVKPSESRVKPPCPVFGECGGCQIMHLDYPAQLQVKRQKVLDALQRIGGFDKADVLPCVPSPHALGYRNKIQLPIVWDNGKKTLGLYRKNTHEIIPINRCFIQCPQGEDILVGIKEKLTIPSVRYVLIRNAIFQNEALVVFVTTGESNQELKQFAKDLMISHPQIKGVVENVNARSGNAILGQTFRPLAGRPFIYERLLNKTFKISPSAFFQVNPGQAEKLYAKAIQLAEIEPHENVLDAYCGVGGLAILAADAAQTVYGIECVPHAIADAKENARLNHLNNCLFTCGNAEELIHQYKHCSTIFLNPPRKGCEASLLKALIASLPKKIVYISCDPATLARDLKLLSAHYVATTIQPFDMFPQTMHVETLVALRGVE